MTNIGHFRAAGKLLEDSGKPAKSKLWIAPPTKMDAAQLTQEGYYGIFGKAGARLEMPGCSLWPRPRLPLPNLRWLPPYGRRQPP